MIAVTYVTFLSLRTRCTHIDMACSGTRYEARCLWFWLTWRSTRWAEPFFLTSLCQLLQALVDELLCYASPGCPLPPLPLPSSLPSSMSSSDLHVHMYVHMYAWTTGGGREVLKSGPLWNIVCLLDLTWQNRFPFSCQWKWSLEDGTWSFILF